MLGRLFNSDPVLTRIDAREYVEALYRYVLEREPDEAGLESHVNFLMAGYTTVGQLLIEFSNSEEAKLKKMTVTPFEPLHESRLQMVQQLPAAKRIVELRTVMDDRLESAIVAMGYPHEFESLEIVVAVGSQDTIRHIDMKVTNLSEVQSNTIDLVFAGQSIEQLSYDECINTLAEVRRILSPTGYFCFDIHNRALTKLQQPDSYINATHQYEYTHQEIGQLLTDAKLAILEEKGIAYMPTSARTHTFRITEMMMNVGMYDEIEQCYLLYYKCRAV